ncbi:MAG: hypothetical protein AB7N73_14910 [Gemmatimonadales bacterium]
MSADVPAPAGRRVHLELPGSSSLEELHDELAVRALAGVEASLEALRSHARERFAELVGLAARERELVLELNRLRELMGEDARESPRLGGGA